MHKSVTPFFLLAAFLFVTLFQWSCTDQKYPRAAAKLSFNAFEPSFVRAKDYVADPITVESLEITPTDFSITGLGETLKLNIIAQFNNNQQSTDATLVSWTTSDENILAVDASGLITSTGSGSATITATLKGLSRSITVDVNETGISINGLVRYEDRAYDQSGLDLFSQIPNYKAVRYATIDLLDAEGNVYKTSETTARGRFDFGKIVPDQYSIRVLAQVENEIAPGFAVKDMRKHIYAVTVESDSSSSTYDIQISANSGVAGAFNILDVMTAAADFSKQMLDVAVSDLNVFWEEESEYGTYYCTDVDGLSCINGEGIYVYSQHRLLFGANEADYDEYDDDVLMHEYGHFVVENFAKDDSPGGCHNLTDNNLDLRLAWSEGLGTFFPIAIKDWLRKTNPGLVSMKSTEPVTLYIDTMRTRANPSEVLISFDIANFDDPDPVASPASAEVYFYASSEIAILKILWGLSQEFGMDRVWDIVENYFKQSRTPTNLATFWDGFIGNERFIESELTTLESIFNERRIFYQADDYEVDDDINSASVVTVNSANFPDHYIYSATADADLDLFAFDALAGKRYVIKTQELRNGIDTSIRILDATGQPVSIGGQLIANDDSNPGSYYRYDPGCFGGMDRTFVDKTSLASEVELNPPSDGRYYVEVKHVTKFNDNFTGHYGSYQLSITE